VYHHAVFALEQKIKLASRDKKFVLKTDIKEACKQVIKNNPELIKQLSKEKEHPISEEETIEKVYHFLLKKTLPLAIP
jgi:hypothetical protein